MLDAIGGHHYTPRGDNDFIIFSAFFASFKKEEAYRKAYTSEQSFRKSAEQYIHFYHDVRPHQTLKYQTPQAFEDEYYAKLTENMCSYSAIKNNAFAFLKF